MVDNENLDDLSVLFLEMVDDMSEKELLNLIMTNKSDDEIYRLILERLKQDANDKN